MQVNGKKYLETSSPCLNNQEGAENLSAKFAWKIDPQDNKVHEISHRRNAMPTVGYHHGRWWELIRDDRQRACVSR
jgi:hypothetical protein